MNHRSLIGGAALIAALLFQASHAQAQAVCPTQNSFGEVVETEAIDLVWSSTKVDFDFVTQGRDQLVAYYNATRNLVVAHRMAGTGQDFYGTVWNYRQLDTMLGSDNHNDVVVAISKDGHFHVLGNMHADRIVYYKTRYPREVRSLERVEVMANPDNERRVTYPHFIQSGDGPLFAQFRVGGSGNGNEVLYRYDDKTGEWSQLLETGLSDGGGIRNAYFSAFTRGPDGRFHVAWVWRSQGGSTMNSQVSYARSADLEHWEDAAGNPLTLPLTYGKTPVAAPVPNEEGMVNGHQKVGFDARGRPLVTYFRYDANRIAQGYLARFEDGQWVQHQITDLDRVTHSPNRRGNLTPTSVQLRNSPVLNADGTIGVDATLLGQPVTITLDGETLTPIRRCLRSEAANPLARWAAHEDPRLRQRTLESRGKADDTRNVSMLSWHSVGGNRDRGFEDIAPPSTLRVHVVKVPDTKGE